MNWIKKDGAKNMVVKSLSPDGVTPIWNKSQMESHLVKEFLPAWVPTSYLTFVSTVDHPAYPCFYAAQAEKKGMIRYAINSSLTEPSVIKHTLEAIYTYFAEVDAMTQRQDEDELLLTLVVFFPPESKVLELQDYARQAWDFLNALHAVDEVPWPSDMPSDPQDPNWSYILGGRPLFVNISTPAHRNRCSRNLGPGMIFMINPRDLFTRIARQWGNQPRLTIYHRQEQYDQIPPYPPHLAPYGEGNPGDELLLYLSPDDNHSKFPFDFRGTFTSSRAVGCPVHGETSLDTNG